MQVATTDLEWVETTLDHVARLIERAESKLRDGAPPRPDLPRTLTDAHGELQGFLLGVHQATAALADAATGARVTAATLSAQSSELDIELSGLALIMLPELRAG